MTPTPFASSYDQQHLPMWKQYKVCAREYPLAQRLNLAVTLVHQPEQESTIFFEKSTDGSENDALPEKNRISGPHQEKSIMVQSTDEKKVTLTVLALFLLFRQLKWRKT